MLTRQQRLAQPARVGRRGRNRPGKINHNTWNDGMVSRRAGGWGEGMADVDTSAAVGVARACGTVRRTNHNTWNDGTRVYGEPVGAGVGVVPGLGDPRDELPNDLGGPERANRKAAERRRCLWVCHDRSMGRARPRLSSPSAHRCDGSTGVREGFQQAVTAGRCSATARESNRICGKHIPPRSS